MNKKMLNRPNRPNRKFSKFFAILVILSILPFPFLFSSNRKYAFGATVLLYSLFSLVILIIGVYSLIIYISSKGKNTVYKSKNKVSTIPIAIICIVFSLFIFISYLPEYYKDIPKFITSEYPVADGILTDLYLHKGKGSSTNFTIDGIKFSIDGIPTSDFLVEGKKYHVCYLPNSKFVIKIERYN